MNEPHDPLAEISGDPTSIRDLKAAPASAALAKTSETLELLEETMHVSIREVVLGTVRVSTRTETHDEVADVALDHRAVDITTITIGRVVDTAPSIRTEGDTTIVPVVEERFVIVKQLFLKEELHIRQLVRSEMTSVPVQLRRQVAVVERLDASGTVVADPEPTPQSQTAPAAHRQGE